MHIFHIKMFKLVLISANTYTKIMLWLPKYLWTNKHPENYDLFLGINHSHWLKTIQIVEEMRNNIKYYMLRIQTWHHWNIFQSNHYGIGIKDSSIYFIDYHLEFLQLKFISIHASIFNLEYFFTWIVNKK